MKLMGSWNWWMPSWLDRLIPDLSFEGAEAEPEPAKA
jgi:RND superfamily putative drug exporter